MDKKLIDLDWLALPKRLHKYFGGAVFDCSCSDRAKTYYLAQSPGFYLKIGKRGSLEKQAILNKYFSNKGFGPRVLEYFYDDTHDYLIMDEIKGVNGCDEMILAEPERFCDVFSENLRRFHDMDCSGCPIVGVTSSIIPEAHSMFLSGKSDPWMLEYAGFSSIDEGYSFLCENEHFLLENTHIHGDACLPNIIISDWKFSGFIDFEGGGIGDRHFDLLWAIWSLGFNLKTEKYRNRFLDGYGREAFDINRFKLCTAIQAFSYCN